MAGGVELTRGTALAGGLKVGQGSNLIDLGLAASATLTVGAEGGSNDINVAIQVSGSGGQDVAEPIALKFYLADDAAGLTPSATAPDGGIAIGTDGALIESVANLSGIAVTEADGDLDITFVESGAATWYLVLVLPNGSLAVSDAIAF